MTKPVKSPLMNQNKKEVILNDITSVTTNITTTVGTIDSVVMDGW